jgi:hypothetical protein
METVTMDTETRRRIIYSIELQLERTPDSPPGSSAAIVLPLNREGLSTSSNGKPRPLKQRTMDLRVGDFVMVNNQWRKILGVRAYRDAWFEGEPADDGPGYVVR